MNKTVWFPSLVLLILLAISLQGTAIADEPNQAGLVIQYRDGGVETQCLAFDEDEIRGVELLDRSGLDVVVDPSSSMGMTVCQIQGQGCAFPSEACFCQCMGGGECGYWNYYYRDSGAGEWVYSPLGVALRKVKPGSVEAWVWGDGSSPPTDELTFDSICLPPTPPATEPPEIPTSTPTIEVTKPVPTTVVAAPTLAHTAAPTPSATSSPAPTVELPSPTPFPATEIGSEPNATSYWPFGLMVLGLLAIGAIVWLRRT